MKGNSRDAPSLTTRHDETSVLTVTVYRLRVLYWLYSRCVPLPSSWFGMWNVFFLKNCYLEILSAFSVSVTCVRKLAVGGKLVQLRENTVPVLLKANSHIECRSHAAPIPFPCHAVPIRVYTLSFPIWFTVWPCLIHTCHAAPGPCQATSQGHITARHRHVWMSIGRPETACGRPARVRLPPAITRSSTKVVIRSIPIR
jgi:hypothetical protein